MPVRVDRADFLRVLESVTPGISQNDIDQAGCFAFHDGRVTTFNEQVACTRKFEIGIQGAVHAAALLQLLSRMPEDVIEVEQKEGKLLVKGKKRRATINMEQEIKLPIDEIHLPEEWESLSPEFGEAVDAVHRSASTKEDEYVLSCVHITPKYIEAGDRFQLIRYQCGVGIERPILVRATSMKKLVGYDLTMVAQTDNWIHFSNPTGLVISCRLELQDYTLEIGKHLKKEGGSPFSMPGGIDEIVARSEIFSKDSPYGDFLQVDLSQDQIKIIGEGARGRFEEFKEVKYSGEPLSFFITPKLLLDISQRSSECFVFAGKLLVDGGFYRFATSTLVKE